MPLNRDENGVWTVEIDNTEQLAADHSHPSYFRFLDVSSGFEDVGQRGREQVDDGDEGGGISIAARA